MICEVLLNDQQCETEYVSTNTRCYRCGDRVCVPCSALVTYRGHRVRMCNDCQHDHPGEFALGKGTA